MSVTSEIQVYCVEKNPTVGGDDSKATTEEKPVKKKRENNNMMAAGGRKKSITREIKEVFIRLGVSAEHPQAERVRALAPQIPASP